jgi:hypothetical protein
MKWDNFGYLTQAQQIAMVLGASVEASYKDEWFPSYKIIASAETKFRIAEKDKALEVEAEQFLSTRE